MQGIPDLACRTGLGHNGVVKILAVSDVVDPRLHRADLKDRLPQVDLVLGCGDLPYEYLEFLVSVFNVPLLYVPGNHDPDYNAASAGQRADGCDQIDRRLVRVKGLTIAGLGGSIRYKPEGGNQYSQSQMWGRVISFAPVLLGSRLVSGRRLDILVAHSPPFGIQDDDDRAHIGFKAFLWLIRTFKPRYFLHGHTLAVRGNLDGSAKPLGSTRVININPYRLIEVESHVQ